jgi:glycerol-3-phosphate acyltransferase PlsY
MQASMITYILFIPWAYLLGSVPFGILVARAVGGVDPRRVGSGNIGATNVNRSAGKGAGALTLLLDLLKGAVPTYVVWRLGYSPVLVSGVGLAAFGGHLWPVFIGFKGGKGVATACGVMAAVAPLAVLFSVIVFLIAVAVKRYVSLGSILAAGMLPVFLSFLPRSKEYLPLGMLIAALVILRHSENIRRLAAGTENKL